MLSGVRLNETEITGIDYCYFNNDVPKTAFITPMELFEFKVLPFGLANSPSAFTEVMNTVFRNFIGKFVVIYLDDIIISARMTKNTKNIFAWYYNDWRTTISSSRGKNADFSNPK